MKINVILEEGAFLPVRAYDKDAGYDLRSPYGVTLWGGESVTINTGVHIEIPEGYAGVLKSKSGLNVKYGITGTGLIDSGYTGAIVCKLYNHSMSPYMIQKGDKIIQLVIVPVLTPELVIADKFETTKRGNRGFGSTGR